MNTKLTRFPIAIEAEISGDLTDSEPVLSGVTDLPTSPSGPSRPLGRHSGVRTRMRQGSDAATVVRGRAHRRRESLQML